MNPGEYEIMARVEERHWWYRGLRDAVSTVLRRPDLALRPQPRVLDAGCGTGRNLKLLTDLLQPSYLGGFDTAEEALSLARAKAPDADLYRSDICDPVLHRGDLDLIVSLDVLYIPGIEKSLSGLRKMVAALRPGGLLILNLPAFEWLYSDHDVAVHTSQRFTAPEVRDLLSELDMTVEILSYRLFFVFPAVIAARASGLLRGRRVDENVRSDLHSVPGRSVSRLLFATLRLENRLIGRGFRLPWGSSVFAVARKR